MVTGRSNPFRQRSEEHCDSPIEMIALHYVRINKIVVKYGRYELNVQLSVYFLRGTFKKASVGNRFDKILLMAISGTKHTETERTHRN